MVDCRKSKKKMSQTERQECAGKKAKKEKAGKRRNTKRNLKKSLKSICPYA